MWLVMYRQDGTRALRRNGMRDETCYCNQYAGVCMARGSRFDSGVQGRNELEVEVGVVATMLDCRENAGNGMATLEFR